jgi:hypothetical protein
LLKVEASLQLKEHLQNLKKKEEESVELQVTLRGSLVLMLHWNSSTDSNGPSNDGT